MTSVGRATHVGQDEDVTDATDAVTGKSGQAPAPETVLPVQLIALLLDKNNWRDNGSFRRR